MRREHLRGLRLRNLVTGAADRLCHDFDSRVLLDHTEKAVNVTLVGSPSGKSRIDQDFALAMQQVGHQLTTVLAKSIRDRVNLICTRLTHGIPESEKDYT